jgi:hypothetical protein
MNISQTPVAQAVNGLGFDANVRVFKKGTKWIAVAMLQTTNGPVKLAASADEATLREAYGMTLGAARQAAQKMATKKVLAKMSVAPTQPQVPVAPQVSGPGGRSSPAMIVNRLYANLMAGDPQAKASVKRIVQLARTGNQRAAVVHNRLRELYQKDSPRTAGYGRDIWNGGPPPSSCSNIWGTGPITNTVPIWGGLPHGASDPIPQPSGSPTFSYQSTTGAHGGHGGRHGGGHGGHGGGHGAYARHGGHRGGRGYGRGYGGFDYPYYDDPYYAFDPSLDPGYVYVDPIIVGNVGCAKTGYYPFPQSNRAGVVMGGNVQLTPARTQQLLGMIQAARFSR